MKLLKVLKMKATIEGNNCTVRATAIVAKWGKDWIELEGHAVGYLDTGHEVDILEEYLEYAGRYNPKRVYQVVEAEVLIFPSETNFVSSYFFPGPKTSHFSENKDFALTCLGACLI